MPDPTNPNTPATTASNQTSTSTAAFPSWEQFLSTFWKNENTLNGMTGRPLVLRPEYMPSYNNPFQGSAWLHSLKRDPTKGWGSLVSSGLLSKYGINSVSDLGEYYHTQNSQRKQAGTDIFQQVFRDWQLQQVLNQLAPAPANQTTTPSYNSQNVTFGTQQTLSDFANTPPVASPLGSYAAALMASMNAAPTVTTTPGVQSSPIAAYINYLMGN